MARKAINSLPGKEARAKRIAQCNQCNGAPPTQHCVLQGLHFDKCELCEEIVGDYYKEGQAIKIKESKTISLPHTDPAYRSKIQEEVREYIPGKQINFNDLQ